MHSHSNHNNIVSIMVAEGNMILDPMDIILAVTVAAMDQRQTSLLLLVILLQFQFLHVILLVAAVSRRMPNLARQSHRPQLIRYMQRRLPFQLLVIVKNTQMKMYLLQVARLPKLSLLELRRGRMKLLMLV